MMIEIILYFLAWLSFAAAHSILANQDLKSKISHYFRGYYRLIYNAFSIVHIALVYAIGWFLFSDIAGFDRSQILTWTQIIIFIFGIIFLVAAAKQYNLGLFIGLTQRRQVKNGESVDESEDLNVKGLNKWMRHPLYSASFLILWGRIASPFDLYTAIFASLYLIIGSKFEERSLQKIYGQDYTDYMKKVPAFIPYKGPFKT